jgi:hypothetical protein
VFTLKHNERGEVVRHKARLVAKGFSQRDGIDYEETYASVTFLNSIRSKMAKCDAEGFEFEQCDVDTAFLYGKLEEDIYMELPEGLLVFLSLAKERLRRVSAAAEPLWSEAGVSCLERDYRQPLKIMGFKPADADPCVYTRGEVNDE